MKKTQEAEMNEQNQNHKIEIMKMEVAHFESEIAALKERLEKNLGSDEQRRNEIERYVSTGRESMERERQDHYLLLVEQNKLKHKVDKLSENCKSYQVRASIFSKFSVIHFSNSLVCKYNLIFEFLKYICPIIYS